jgi:3'(2'), 5'-bisphosphate nucleotidase
LRPGVDTADPQTLAHLCSIAQDAGREILRHSCTEVACTLKADASPVTAADVAAERRIVEALTSWDSTVRIVAEESAASHEGKLAADRCWLIDPLDGTKEFLAGSGEFTVNIALLEGGHPVLGVVFAPMLDVMYAAGRGLGAWRQFSSRRPERIVSRRWHHGQPARIVESRSHPSAALEAYLRTVHVSERVRLGSSLKFCRVAEGSADLYPRFGTMMHWDVGAGDCIYRNSGPDGERDSPIRYDAADLRVPGFILGLDEGVGSARVATF